MKVLAVSIAAVQVMNPANDHVMATALYIDGGKVEWPEDEITNFVECLPSQAVNQVRIEELLPDELEDWEYN